MSSLVHVPLILRIQHVGLGVSDGAEFVRVEFAGPVVPKVERSTPSPVDMRDFRRRIARRGCWCRAGDGSHGISSAWKRTIIGSSARYAKSSTCPPRMVSPVEMKAR
ncbi:hypothetical protein KC361_g288 [Hortaea werneckii]|nr:hypothetical protein KC361_g288 [Hortaea werneckii]